MGFNLPLGGGMGWGGVGVYYTLRINLKILDSTGSTVFKRKTGLEASDFCPKEGLLLPGGVQLSCWSLKVFLYTGGPANHVIIESFK